MNLNSNDTFSIYNDSETNDLLSYLDSWLISYQSHLNFDENFTAGIEIEFDNVKLCDVKKEIDAINLTIPKINMWITEPDKSIDENKIIGGEVVSTARNMDKFFFKELKTVLDHIKEIGGEASEKTGSHIHFGAHILGDSEVAWSNLLKTWLIYEKVIYRFGYGTRTIERPGLDEYAKPLTCSYFYINELIRILKRVNIVPDDIKQFLDYRKFFGLNFMNISGKDYEERNTVEVRCPNGTLDPIIWQNNINFFGHLITKMNNIDQNFLDFKFEKYTNNSNLKEYRKINTKSALELADILFDNNLDKLNFLKQYFKNFQTKDKQVVLTK